MRYRFLAPGRRGWVWWYRQKLSGGLKRFWGQDMPRDTWDEVSQACSGGAPCARRRSSADALRAKPLVAEMTFSVRSSHLPPARPRGIKRRPVSGDGRSTAGMGPFALHSWVVLRWRWVRTFDVRWSGDSEGDSAGPIPGRGSRALHAAPVAGRRAYELRPHARMLRRRRVSRLHAAGRSCLDRAT